MHLPALAAAIHIEHRHSLGAEEAGSHSAVLRSTEEGRQLSRPQ